MWGRSPAAERGDISNWLTQLLVVLAVVGLVIYEVVAVGVTTVSVDDAAREVARAARDTYRSEESLEGATETAEAVAGLRDATVTSVEVEGEELSVTLEKQAGTLVMHRIGPLEGVTTRSSTTQVNLRP